MIVDLRPILFRSKSTLFLLLQIDKLKAVLSNKEYQIITECALENMSETPNVIPPLEKFIVPSINNVTEHVVSQGLDDGGSDSQSAGIWIATKVSVVVGVVELSLHYGLATDASLATLQVYRLTLLKLLVSTTCWIRVS